ncbi:hypothetical protein [Streptomyces sp. NPDC048002]|uniref:hypothetical protein n=1 Tax=Streptomyces sp. NPDC048002 TaxID=3154344 RepID=UPI00340EBA40
MLSCLLAVAIPSSLQATVRDWRADMRWTCFPRPLDLGGLLKPGYNTLRNEVTTTVNHRLRVT